jgi:penicillin amidase
MWWTFLENDTQTLDAFYEMDRADTRDKARSAASKIDAPGLNVVWANAQGDIAWWAAAKLVQRPAGVNSYFILDSASGQAEKPGYYRFADNPQEENPARGYIVSANHQPAPRSGVPVPGYYNLPDRARRLDALLGARADGWTVGQSQTLQLDTTTGYAVRLLRPLIPALRKDPGDGLGRLLVDQLGEWDGQFDTTSIGATVFTQFAYELVQAAMADEMGPLFPTLLRTRLVEAALPRLAADPDSPWWDDRSTPGRETREDIVRKAWQATIAHLRKERGDTPTDWTWGRAHTLTHVHPLGRVEPLDRIFNVGPFPAPGGRELPNNLAQAIGPSPWAVILGPSTRRVIDFASPAQALGISPVGQSGVLLDEHYADQAADYVAGRYQAMHLDAGDVRRNTRSTLTLEPEQ